MFATQKQKLTSSTTIRHACRGVNSNHYTNHSRYPLSSDSAVILKRERETTFHHIHIYSHGPGGGVDLSAYGDMKILTYVTNLYTKLTGSAVILKREREITFHLFATYTYIILTWSWRWRRLVCI